MLRFNPPPYENPEPTGYERANQWAGSLNDLGRTFGQVHRENRLTEQQELENALKMMTLRDQVGDVGMEEFRYRMQPKKVLQDSPGMVKPLPVDPNMAQSDPMEFQRRFGSNRLKMFQDREDRQRTIDSDARSGRLMDSQIAENQSTTNKNNRWRPGDDGPKVPAGFRWKSDGSMEPIPGGPAYLKTTEKGGDRAAALNLYETAKQGLLDGLRGTNTGPIMGRMPAFTSGQQIAEGGVAAMAPVLKQLFRVSGEGVFTDRDQQLLLDMIPTRKTNPDAFMTQIENIDRIVKAKLGMSGGQGGGMQGMIDSAIGPADQGESASAARRARIAELRARQGAR